ncbi:MAG: putative Ig domain-containing protein [Steroidobacteraceae bacterium]
MERSMRASAVAMELLSLNLNGLDYGQQVIQQADGKLIVTGYSSDNSAGNFSLARYNADGSLDPTFGGGDGILVTNLGLGETDDHAYGVVQQVDGKLVVVGASVSPESWSDDRIALVRYNPDGSLDTSFGDGGIPDQVLKEGTGFLLNVPANLFTDPDGGKITYSLSLVDGSPLPEWMAFDPVSRNLSGVVPVGAPDLDVRIAATDVGMLSAVDVFHLATTLAPAYQTGVVTTAVGREDLSHALLVQSDGSLLVVGESVSDEWDEGGDIFMVRYNANGTVDRIAMADIGNYEQAFGVAQQADGKVLLTGVMDAEYSGDPNDLDTSDVVLLRYNRDGTLDTTFGGGDGVARADLGDNDYGASIIQKADGKVVVLGASDGEAVLLRYNTDGSLDSTFGDSGVVRTDSASSSSNGSFILQQADGRLVVATSDHLLRYLPDGQVDMTFGGGDGIADVALSQVPAQVLQQADGRLVIAGADGVTRYDADGTPDLSFGGGDGIVTLQSTGASIGAVLIRSDGTLVAAGSKGDLFEDLEIVLARYNADGMLDTSFGGGDGVVTVDSSLIPIGFLVGPKALVQGSDNKLVLLANFMNDGFGWLYPNTDVAVLRFNGDGTLDTSFRAVGDQQVSSGVPFRITVSQGLFYDPDQLGSTSELTATLTQSNGAPIPSWLAFYDGNAGPDQFGGTPPSGADDLSLRLTMEDVDGASTWVDFTLSVIDRYVSTGTNESFAAGVGKDLFVFSSGFGQDRITGFAVAEDVIDLSGVTNPDWTSFADVQAHTTQIGSDAVIDFGGGNTITLVGVAAASLTAADFQV